MGNVDAEATSNVTPTEQLGDVRWAYEHYADEQVSEGDAPSAGAWGLLSACRSDRNAYLKVLERVHPKDGGLVGEESATQLLELDARIQKEWGQLAGVLELACKRPEFTEELALWTREWKKAHPAGQTPAQAEAFSRVTGNTMTPDEVPA